MYLYLWRSRLMIRAIYPGSFDPVTFGHLDLIFKICDRTQSANNKTCLLLSCKFYKQPVERHYFHVAEIQMSQTNHKLEPEVETMFLTTNLKYSYLSSTIVREVAAFGGDISQFVPETVAKSIKEKMSQ